MINDWKSSFLIASILKEAPAGLGLEACQEGSERLLTAKVCEILGVDQCEEAKASSYMKLMEKGELDSVGRLIRELLLCSVMTRSNTVEPLFQSMMDSLVFYTRQLTASSLLVHKDFYLPAPPIFCIQMSNQGSLVEVRYHKKSKRVVSSRFVSSRFLIFKFNLNVNKEFFSLLFLH